MHIYLELDRYPIQREFVLDKTPNLAFLGGRGAGKTKGGALKGFLTCIQNKGIRGLVTAPIYKDLTGSTIPAYLATFPAGMVEFHKGDMQLTTTQGNQIFFRSTEDPESLRGYDVGFLHMDEGRGSPLKAWQNARACVRQPEMPCQAWVTSTPAGHDWIYQEFFASKKPGYKLYQARTQDNPYPSEDYVKQLRETYGVELALQEIEGQFIAATGCYFDIPKLAELLLGAREGEVFKPHVIGRRYAAAIDPAGQGTGKSASAHSLSILDCQTGEFVVDYTTMESPEDFSYKAHKLLGEFHNPFLQIEPNGVGQGIIAIIKNLGYPNFLYADADKDRKKIGWPASANLQDRMLVDLAIDIRQGALIPYSRAAIDELFSFERKEKGSPRAASGAHDDRVRAMAWTDWVSKQVKPVLGSIKENVYVRL